METTKTVTIDGVDYTVPVSALTPVVNVGSGVAAQPSNIDLATLFDSNTGADPAETVTSPTVDNVSAPVANQESAAPVANAPDPVAALFGNPTPPTDRNAPNPKETLLHNASVGQVISEIARRFSIDPVVALSVAQVRSNLNPKFSSDGYYGLFALPLTLFNNDPNQATNAIQNSSVALEALSQLDMTSFVANLPENIKSVYDRITNGENIRLVLPNYDARTGLSLYVPA